MSESDWSARLTRKLAASKTAASPASWNIQSSARNTRRAVTRLAAACLPTHGPVVHVRSSAQPLPASGRPRRRGRRQDDLGHLSRATEDDTSPQYFHNDYIGSARGFAHLLATLSVQLERGRKSKHSRSLMGPPCAAASAAACV